MNTKLKGLDQIIDRWINLNVNRAINKDYAKLYLKQDRIKWIGEPSTLIQPQAFEKIYHHYLLGNFDAINSLFENDTYIVENIFSKTLTDDGLSERAIKLKKRKKVKYTKQTFPNRDLFDSYDEYIITDKTLKEELIKNIRNFIFYREIQRKLGNTNTLNSISTEKDTKQIESKKYELGDYALMQVYLSLSGEGEGVTNKNKDIIAKKYKVSGRRLYEMFNKYSKSDARTETISPRSNTEKKKRFEKVKELLQHSPVAMKRAIDEEKTFIAASLKTYE